MRKGLAARASDDVAAERNSRSNARAILVRASSCLLGLLLVLQLAGVAYHNVRAAAPPDAKSIALAGLSVAIGEPVTLCDHGGDPAHPGDPAGSGGCEHCIFCHSVAVGVVAVPVATGIARVAVPAEVARPSASLALVRARHLGAATPRGPPAFG